MSGTVASPDLLLARRAAAGQEDAWRDLVAAHGARIYNLALQFARSREEAEDLTQEIFLRLYQNLRGYRGEVPFAGWALRLSRNLCIDHYRRSREERRAAMLPAEVLESIAGPADPHADVQRSRERREIERALAALPLELAEILVLRDLQGWTVAEAAAALAVPEGTVKSRLHRARAAARGLLAPSLAPSSSARADAAEGGRHGG